VHGDYRLDNLMFGADDDDVVVVDWQTLDIGRPPVTSRISWARVSRPSIGVAEHELVAEYHAALCTRGITDYGPTGASTTIDSVCCKRRSYHGRVLVCDGAS
jgi:hypothetical protein